MLRCYSLAIELDHLKKQQQCHQSPAFCQFYLLSLWTSTTTTRAQVALISSESQPQPHDIVPGQSHLHSSRRELSTVTPSFELCSDSPVLTHHPHCGYLWQSPYLPLQGWVPPPHTVQPYPLYFRSTCFRAAQHTVISTWTIIALQFTIGFILSSGLHPMPPLQTSLHWPFSVLAILCCSNRIDRVVNKEQKSMSTESWRLGNPMPNCWHLTTFWLYHPMVEGRRARRRHGRDRSVSSFFEGRTLAVTALMCSSALNF
jgi:hypothetical protein